MVDRMVGHGRTCTVLTGCALVVWLLLAGCTSDGGSGGDDTTPTTTVAPTTTNPRGTVSGIDDVLVGQCADDVPEPEQRNTAVIVVPCADPHTYEIYDQQEYFSEESTAPGVAFPGDTIVSNVAENQCIAEFETFVGVRWEASEYDVQAWWPSADSWANANDRLVTCAVYRLNGEPSNGSARDSSG